jgi:hypothetical protein
MRPWPFPCSLSFDICKQLLILDGMQAASSKLSIAVGIVAVAIIALQWSKIESQQTELTEAQNRLHLASQTNEQQQSAIRDLRASAEKLTAASHPVVAETPLTAPLKAASAPPAPSANAPAPQAKGFGGMMENMMKDPDFMKAVSQQQAQVIKTQYAPLVKQLDLTPDQRDAFYKALTDNMTNAMAQGLAMMSGTNNPEATSTAAAAQKSMQEQMKSLLGDAGYAQFQDYQTSLPDRVLFDQMKTSFSDNPLTDDQQQRLLQLMITERKITVTAMDPATGMPYAPSAANSAAQLEKSMQDQEQVNLRVYQQAADFLSPAQLQTLGASQSNLLNLTKISMSMAKKFMGTNAMDSGD